MNVNDMYEICRFAVNKQQNGYLGSTDFNRIINQAQTSYLDYLLGEFQQYQYGREEARIQYSANSVIRQRISPLLVNATLTIDSAGASPYPVNYVQVDTMWKSDGVNRVRYIQQDALYSYYNSQIDPIATNPIYLLESTGFRFYPITLASAKVMYIKNAPDIVWAYTLDANGREVYSESGGSTVIPVTGSVQPVWAYVDLLEIITRALKLIGLNLKDGMVEQYANQVTNTGQ